MFCFSFAVTVLTLLCLTKTQSRKRLNEWWKRWTRKNNRIHHKWIVLCVHEKGNGSERERDLLGQAVYACFMIVFVDDGYHTDDMLISHFLTHIRSPETVISFRFHIELTCRLNYWFSGQHSRRPMLFERFDAIVYFFFFVRWRFSRMTCNKFVIKSHHKFCFERP